MLEFTREYINDNSSGISNRVREEYGETNFNQAIDHAINCVGAIEQIKWERDIAIQQLNELGYELGEKIREEEYRWVDVNNRLPIESGYYLVTNGAKELDIRKYDYGWFHDMYRRYSDEELKVIAWRKINPFEPLDIRPKAKI